MSWLIPSFWRRRSRGSASRWDLSTPLLWLTKSDPWTIGDACQGTQAFGSTGAGKTSGSLATILRAFLRQGFGGLLLTSKPDDRRFYERLCRETGRGDDLMIFGPGGGLRYNPLDAELRRRDAGAGLTENVTALLSTLLEVSERNSQQGGGEDSGYWKRANRQLMRNAVDLLVFAKDRVSVPELYKIVVSAPTSLEQMRSEEWRKESFCFQCLGEADARTKTPRQRADFELVADYFALEFAGLSGRTRSVVVSTFTSMLDVLNRGVVRELVSSADSNCTPEMAQDGKLILIDLPVKVFGELGVFLQVLWKHCFQVAQERRDVNANARPVFLCCDESHLFTVSRDQIFQTTARSSRTAVLYATQTMSNYLAALGENSEATVHSLLSNLQTKIFHQQADVKTNAYASELIGRTRQFMVNSSTSNPLRPWPFAGRDVQTGQASAGVNEVYEAEVQPRAFTTLAQGGPPSWRVEAIVYQGGRRFSTTGGSWTRATFAQRF